MKSFRNALVFSLRQMARTPGNTVLCIFILAGCIALATSMFRLCTMSFLWKAPYGNRESLVSLVRTDDRKEEYRFWNPDSAERALAASADLFSGTLRAFSDGTTIRIGERKIMTGYCYLEWDFAQKLGVQPILGRSFSREEANADASPVALVSEALWRERFGGSPNVLGKTVSLFGRERTIVGVMPEVFDFPAQLGKDPGGVWLPMNRDRLLSETGWVKNVRLYGLLAPGVSLRKADARFSEIARQVAAALPEENKNIAGGRLRKLDGTFMPDPVKDIVSVTSICALLILFMGCGIVSGLLTVRHCARAQELSIRVALGATRGRIAGLMLCEFLLISGTAMILGLLLDCLFQKTLMPGFYSAFRIPPYMNTVSGGLMFAFAAGILCLVTMLSSLLPALRASSVDPAAVLRDSSRTGSSIRMTRLSGFVITLQVATACVVLAGGTMIGGKILDMCRDEIHYTPSDYLCAEFSLDKTDYADAALKYRTFNQLVEELRKNPEIEKVGYTTEFFGRNGPQWGGSIRVAIDGATYETENDLPKVLLRNVSPGYFASFDIPVLRGRDFEPGDDADHQQVAAVTDAFARKYFGTEDAVGRLLRLGGRDSPPVTVIAVVPDVYNNWNEPSLNTGIFLPYAQHAWEWVALYLRGRERPENYARFLEVTIRRIDNRLPVFATGTIRELRDKSNGAVFLKFILSYFGFFAAGSLLMAAGGLYGVIAFAAGTRRREMGIRTVLGARPTGLVLLLARRGGAFVAIGLVIGALASVLVHRLLEKVFDGLLADSWQGYALAGTLLVAICAAAIFIPSLKGACVDPAKALHGE